MVSLTVCADYYMTTLYTPGPTSCCARFVVCWTSVLTPPTSNTSQGAGPMCNQVFVYERLPFLKQPLSFLIFTQTNDILCLWTPNWTHTDTHFWTQMEFHSAHGFAFFAWTEMEASSLTSVSTCHTVIPSRHTGQLTVTFT